MGLYRWIKAVPIIKPILIIFILGLVLSVIYFLATYYWSNNKSPVVEVNDNYQEIIKDNPSKIIDLSTLNQPESNVSAISDQVQIQMLYPTKKGGRIWNSTSWSNNESRTIPSGKVDSFDSEFIARGNGTVFIDGAGTAQLQGSAPRMYVYDNTKKKKWNNVEVTVYAKRISESGTVSSQGIVIGARSEHQDATLKNPCLGATYYGRLLYDGRAVFQKEVIHEGVYSVNKPSEENKAKWNTPNGVMPSNIWIGVKFIVMTNPDKKSVMLELYRDLTDGKNGGKWEKIAEYTDKGDWFQNDSKNKVKKKCGYSANKVLLEPGTSVFIRNDKVSNVQYKLFSIREIE